MKEIIALKEYTDSYISLYQGEIRNIADDMALRLIEKGVVAEHDNINPNGNNCNCNPGYEVTTGEELYSCLNFKYNIHEDMGGVYNFSTQKEYTQYIYNIFKDQETVNIIYDGHIDKDVPVLCEEDEDGTKRTSIGDLFYSGGDQFDGKMVYVTGIYDSSATNPEKLHNLVITTSGDTIAETTDQFKIAVNSVSPIFFNITITQHQNVLRADKTYDEIIQAIQSGKIPIAVFTYPNNTRFELFYFQMRAQLNDEDDDILNFSNRYFLYNRNNTEYLTKFQILQIYSDDTVVKREITYSGEK